MTARTFDATGVRAIVIENLGRGSINVEPGPREDLVEGTVTADEELLQQASIRHEADTLRIWFPDQLFRTQTAHIRIGPRRRSRSTRSSTSPTIASKRISKPAQNGRCRS